MKSVTQLLQKASSFMANDDKSPPSVEGTGAVAAVARPPKRTATAISVKKVDAKTLGKGKRTRTSRPYPASSFEEAIKLADAIQKYAAGEKVRRLTLLGHLNKSPTSSSTQMLITNSGKYGITKGSFVADWLELTED